MTIALDKLVKLGMLKRSPVREAVAATSVGIVGGQAWLDLCYEEDSQADVDMNLIMTASGKFVEVQATGEQAAFDDAQLASMVGLAREGIRELIEIQRGAIQSA
jgi:ribonuclease PH